jgi:MYXO-CTERM domain-containing protein
MAIARIAAAFVVWVVFLAPGAAGAHFVLKAPASWAEQDGQGNPQKTAPCGQSDPQVAAVPTNAVTTFRPGDTFTVTIDETTFHPGHYRVVLSTAGRGGLPPDPEPELPGTCMTLPIQNPPVFPVLADGMLPHTDPLQAGPQSFQVTLPADVTCTNCTLQVLEFMQADTGGGGNCFYHHCASLTISEPDAGIGCGCATGEGRTSWLSLLLGLVLIVLAPRRRVFLAIAPLLAVAVAACDGRSRRNEFTASPGEVEQTWLARVGTGPAQTAAVCARGAADPIARALCASPAPAVAGLTDLYRALDLAPGRNALAAVATHSLGLSARTVSALNPRVVVFPRYSPLDMNQVAAVAFSRGEPFVELAGYDPAANDFNFYLLAFEPACRNACAPADFLTERLESGWLGWTLYGEADLEDTPLDCTSCHRPNGPSAPRRLLMRQIDGPWMHWGDFRGVSGPIACTEPDGSAVAVDARLTFDGADLLRQLNGPGVRHGGVAVADLVAAPSGYDLSSFLFYVAGYADGPGDVPCLPPYCPYSEPYPFGSQDVLCDLIRTGRADVAGGAWDRYRAQARTRGQPVPHFAPDVLDPSARASVAADFGAFVATRPPATATDDGDDTFARLSGLLAPEAARAIGFVPGESDTAEEMLRNMCVRCHGAGLDARLARSRFNAAALDQLVGAGAQEVLRRIRLPRTSPERMPPLRAGELPASAVDRIAAFLAPRL